jgi:tRNA threonylcarbamoyladenosine biosynthesis protein TsaE
MAPILDENALEFVSHSAEQTRRLGAHLGALLQGGDTICLQGELGSGKTCLAQGVGRGWGVSQTLISPSFVLVREYGRPGDNLRLCHIDLYRISGVVDALSLGIDELLGAPYAVCIIEWPERAKELMPAEHLWVTLTSFEETRRAISLTARGERHAEILRRFRHVAFGI